MKKLFSLVSVLVVLSMLLSACAQPTDAGAGADRRRPPRQPRLRRLRPPPRLRSQPRRRLPTAAPASHQAPAAATAVPTVSPDRDGGGRARRPHPH